MPSTLDILPHDIRHTVLTSGDVSVTILSLGCITHDWRVPLGDNRVPVVLSYADPKDHLYESDSYKGVIAGRVANRISRSCFELDGETIVLAPNEGIHQLHGGPAGISNRNWQLETDGHRAVQLRLHSPHGDQGFPGNVDFTTIISLSGTTLTYEMAAVTDRPSPINLAQHSYYNLMGSGTVWDHELQIRSAGYTPVDEELIPTGTMASLDDTRFDFRKLRKLREADPDRHGIDVNIVLSQSQSEESPTAILKSPNRLCLKLWTDQPGLQLYTGRYLSQNSAPLESQSHEPFTGVCLEPQHYPDSPNRPEFPSIICTPDRPYHQKLVVDIAPASEIKRVIS